MINLFINSLMINIKTTLSTDVIFALKTRDISYSIWVQLSPQILLSGFQQRKWMTHNLLPVSQIFRRTCSCLTETHIFL